MRRRRVKMIKMITLSQMSKKKKKNSNILLGCKDRQIRHRCSDSLCKSTAKVKAVQTSCEVKRSVRVKKIHR